MDSWAVDGKVFYLEDNPYYRTLNGSVFSASDVGSMSANCTIPTCPVELSVYGYRASIANSAVGIALYAIVAIAQLFLGLKFRSWWFMGSMLFGCIDEILGYVGRILMYQNPWKQPGFIMQIVLITIGPVFFSAAIYVLLSQIILYISPTKSRFTPKLFTYAFIPCDIVSLILQAVGGAMSSTSNGKNQAGVDIALAGLGFQVATLVVFIVFVADYAWRSRSVWKNAYLSTVFKVFCFFLAAATTFILIRCCYRVYELSQGYSRNSVALRDQPLFIGLESVMVLLAAFCLIVAHPGFALTGRTPLSDSEKGRLESKNLASDSEQN